MWYSPALVHSFGWWPSYPGWRRSSLSVPTGEILRTVSASSFHLGELEIKHWLAFKISTCLTKNLFSFIYKIYSQPTTLNKVHHRLKLGDYRLLFSSSQPPSSNESRTDTGVNRSILLSRVAREPVARDSAPAVVWHRNAAVAFPPLLRCLPPPTVRLHNSCLFSWPHFLGFSFPTEVGSIRRAFCSLVPWRIFSF